MFIYNVDSQTFNMLIYSVDMQTFNMLILGVDSISRLNFMRHMPRTREFLLNQLSAIDLKGFCLTHAIILEFVFQFDLQQSIVNNLWLFIYVVVNK